MGAASKYWKLVRIDTAGRRKTEEIGEAKAFFRQQFPEFADATEVPDAQVQRQLLHWFRAKSPDSEAVGADGNTLSLSAQMCLRCLISNLIEQACIQLEASFGSNHGFTRLDLFVFVLDDFTVGCEVSGRAQPSSYQSLATEILQTYAPERGSLATWTTRLVKHHRELNAFLLQHGVYMVSDWAILNDTNSQQLQRIFSSFHHRSAGEIQQAVTLLESYHAVYRRDRVAARLAGTKGQCPLPSLEQLRLIANRVQVDALLTLSPQDVMTRLQDIAELLREYRIYVRGGSPPTESLDNSQETQSEYLQLSSPDWDKDEELQTEFLTLYRQQFLTCLDGAIDKVTRDRITQLERKNSQIAQQFTKALHLFHCQGKSMGEIAPLVGLQAQYQVTRLLKLKNFRADVRQLMIKNLLRCIIDKAIQYADPKRLLTLERQVEVALVEQVDAVIQEAEIEGSTPKKSVSSLFSTRLCRYLCSLCDYQVFI